MPKKSISLKLDLEQARMLYFVLSYYVERQLDYVDDDQMPDYAQDAQEYASRATDLQQLIREAWDAQYPDPYTCNACDKTNDPEDYRD